MIRISMWAFVGLAVASSAALAAITPTWTYSTDAPILSTPKMADLDGDGTQELIVTTFSTNPDNPYENGYVHVLQANGFERLGWPYFDAGAPIPATPAIGDLDGDGMMEIVVGSWDQMYVFRQNGTLAEGFPRSVGTNETAALYDLVGDSDLEIVYPSNNRLYVMDRQGNTLTGWPYSIQSNYTIGSPVIGDIDGDGEVEIVAGSYQGPVDETPFRVYAWEIDGSLVPGWPFMTSGVVKACPALGDFDGDEDVEIVVGAYDTSNDDFLYLLQGDGTLMPGWPQRAGRNRLSPPGLADTDGDQVPEIFVGGGSATPPYGGRIFAFRADGTSVPGFPVSLPDGGQVNDALIILDADGDPTRLEIFVKNVNNVHGYHSDGTVITGFPFQLNDQGHTGTYSPGPLAGDADMDGDVEFVFCSNFDAVYFFDSYGPFNEMLAFWPSYKHDTWNTGNLGTRVPADVAIGDPHIGNTPLLTCSPNPFQEKTWIVLRDPPRGRSAALSIFDVAGRRVRTIPTGINTGHATAVVWDGSDNVGRMLPAGSYFVTVDESAAVLRLVLAR